MPDVDLEKASVDEAIEALDSVLPLCVEVYKLIRREPRPKENTGAACA